jgi:hypothetical protein
MSNSGSLQRPLPRLSEDFPLKQHKTGKFRKTIKRKDYYFGWQFGGILKQQGSPATPTCVWGSTVAYGRDVPGCATRPNLRRCAHRVPILRAQATVPLRGVKPTADEIGYTAGSTSVASHFYELRGL